MKKPEENSVIANMRRRPVLSINDRNIALGLLEIGTCVRVADVARRFGYNESTIYRLRARFRQTASEKESPRLGRPWITMPRADRFIVTSSRHNRFIAAPKHVERLRHATGTRISDYTARNSVSVIQARGGHTRYWLKFKI